MAVLDNVINVALNFKEGASKAGGVFSDITGKIDGLLHKIPGVGQAMDALGVGFGQIVSAVGNIVKAMISQFAEMDDLVSHSSQVMKNTLSDGAEGAKVFNEAMQETPQLMGEMADIGQRLSAVMKGSGEETAALTRNILDTAVALGGTTEGAAVFARELAETAAAGKMSTQSYRQMTQANAGYASAVRDTIIEQKGMVGGVTEFMEAMKEGSVSAEDLQNAIEVLGEQYSGSATQIYSFNDAMKLIDASAAAMSYNIISKALEDVGISAGQVGEQIQKFFDYLNQAGGFAEKLSGVFAVAFKIIKTAIETVAPAIEPILDIIGTLFDILTDILRPVIDLGGKTSLLAAAFEALGIVLRGIGLILKAVGTAIDFLMTGVTSLLRVLKGDFKGAGQAWKDFGDRVKDTANSVFQSNEKLEYADKKAGKTDGVTKAKGAYDALGKSAEDTNKKLGDTSGPEKSTSAYKDLKRATDDAEESMVTLGGTLNNESMWDASNGKLLKRAESLNVVEEATRKTEGTIIRTNENISLADRILAEQHKYSAAMIAWANQVMGESFAHLDFETRAALQNLETEMQSFEALGVEVPAEVRKAWAEEIKQLVDEGKINMDQLPAYIKDQLDPEMLANLEGALAKQKAAVEEAEQAKLAALDNALQQAIMHSGKSFDEIASDFKISANQVQERANQMETDIKTPIGKGALEARNHFIELARLVGLKESEIKSILAKIDKDIADPTKSGTATAKAEIAKLGDHTRTQTEIMRSAWYKASEAIKSGVTNAIIAIYPVMESLVGKAQSVAGRLAAIFAGIVDKAANTAANVAGKIAGAIASAGGEAGLVKMFNASDLNGVTAMLQKSTDEFTLNASGEASSPTNMSNVIRAIDGLVPHLQALGDDTGRPVNLTINSNNVDARKVRDDLRRLGVNI